MSQRIILTGATGMVGEGVLLTLLGQPDVETVLSISRKPSGHAHPKLHELLVPDFFELAGIEEELKGYTACFFCAGVSSVGMKKAEYARATHDLTLHFARTLVRSSPTATFIYVSGAGTGGRLMWAQVKLRTENALLALPFRAAYMFRPAGMKPVAGQRHVRPVYRWFSWLVPVARLFNLGSTLREVGQAMLRAAERGAPKKVLKVKDINQLGQ